MKNSRNNWLNSPREVRLLDFQSKREEKTVKVSFLSPLTSCPTIRKRLALMYRKRRKRY